MNTHDHRNVSALLNQQQEMPERGFEPCNADAVLLQLSHQAN